MELSGKRMFLSRLLFIKETAGIIMLVLIVLIFYILSPVFISLDNLKVILHILPELGIVALWQESISLPQRVERIDHIDQFDVRLLLLQSLEYRLCGDGLSQASHMNVAGRSDASGDQLLIGSSQQVLGDDVRPVHVISRPQQPRALLT